MLRSPSVPAILLAASVLPASWAWADNADTANKSNNPLNLAPGANLQDYYSPRLFDTNAHTNDLLLRGTLPIAPSDVLGVPQLLRATLPVSTRPDPHSGYSTGIGDLKNNTHYIPIGFGAGKAWKAGGNIFNAFLEPQWTVARKGDDLPQFTLFAGINVTFGK
ncbi:hypothetical protein [uncultured Pseudomonas sp.]|uniref:hypothetical protein n=1 Tax=uncultured Pseudomonas sp. TaxID=114707 RepID=UPI0025EABA8D|nr:hypothetical protein [uncultured Pseudomonas sp.]